MTSGEKSTAQNRKSQFRRSPISRPASRVSRAGLSLLEVLISIFILSIGLLGVAALIPIGKLSLVETNISDRTGACGRAALREIKVRRLLDPNYWSPAIPSTMSFAVDPLGLARGLLNTLGPLARINRTGLAPDDVFIWPDDLIFTLPKDMNPPQSDDNRPAPPPAGVPQSEGNFSWFFTATPSPAEASLPPAQWRSYTVSVVVCHQRIFDSSSERVTTQNVTFVGNIGYGGGTIQLNAADKDLVQHLKTDQWVLLCSTGGAAVAKWYRVVGVSDADPPYVSLVGPDWDTTTYPTQTLVAVDGVTGVYTSTITLDTGSVWNQ